MARKKKHEEHQNHEAWAIPYGDLVTLLFALFTVMYAMSSVNEGKYRILSDSLVAAFRGAPTSNRPIKIGEAAKGQGGDAKLSGVTPTALMKLRDPRPQVDPAVHSSEKHPGGGAAISENDPRAALFKMAQDVREALQNLIDQQMVRVRESAFSLEVEIKTDILFQSGAANVSPEAVAVIQKVGEILKPFPNPIRVEGHTDNRPISTSVFPSNWELSAARAANVVQLFTKDGVDPKRMEVLGLGEQRPVGPNDTLEGRNANRRVVIVVLQMPTEPNGDVQKSIDTGNAALPAVAAAPVPVAPAARAPVPLAAGAPPPTVLAAPDTARIH